MYKDCHFVEGRFYTLCKHCDTCKNKIYMCIDDCNCEYCICCKYCSDCNKCIIEKFSCCNNKCSRFDIKIESFLGKTFTVVEKHSISYLGDVILWVEDNGNRYIMFKEKDCCASGKIKDIVGDLSDLIGTPIVGSYLATNSSKDTVNSFTWSFYNLATNKGYVSISWYGESSGYYSEEVIIKKMDICAYIYSFSKEEKKYCDYIMNL